jgi:hypothetical protein
MNELKVHYQILTCIFIAEKIDQTSYDDLKIIFKPGMPKVS